MLAQRPGDILIVDDDPTFLSSACLTLTRCRHGVVSCASLDEAYHQIEHGSFDAVLCAQNLPDGEGQALCQFIKSNPELQRVSFALLVDTVTKESVLAQPVIEGLFGMAPVVGVALPDDVIAKTVTGEELALRVRSLLRMRRYLEEISNSIGALMTVAEGVEEQDKRARGHCRRLSTMAIELGAMLGCDEWQLTILERAGYLHDIGKVSIPDAIIEKATPLSPRELEIIQDHCVLGENLCHPIAALQPVLPIIRHHHERIDGSGYPDGLQGNHIPILAQIFSIVDIYDSLRTWRPYRAALSEIHAVELMNQEVAKGLWNKKIFEAFKSSTLPGLDQRLDGMHILWPEV